MVDRAEIARIKILHRPDLYWRNGEVFAGCSCGCPYHPCDTLIMALESEHQIGVRRRLDDPPLA